MYHLFMAQWLMLIYFLSTTCIVVFVVCSNLQHHYIVLCVVKYSNYRWLYYDLFTIQITIFLEYPKHCFLHCSCIVIHDVTSYDGICREIVNNPL